MTSGRRGSPELEGKVALVSGSASGIGEAVTRRFAAQCARLWLNDVNADRLRALLGDLSAAAVESRGDAGHRAGIGILNA